MRSYDRIDIELCKQAPRGWSLQDYEAFNRAEYWMRKQILRGPYLTGLHIAIRQADRAYRERFGESPWDAEYNRNGKWIEATGVGIIFPLPEVPEAPPAPPEPPPPLEATCPRCGFAPRDADAEPTPVQTIEDAIDKKLILSMRAEAREIVRIVVEAGGFEKLTRICEVMRNLHDHDNPRTTLVCSHLFREGILERPERGVYRIPKVAA